ncbi:anti-sigma factor family protein [Chengkuizengella sediminis]|uniref:anti-sigma factor family protein n=1 Tax=Chengkuizengella sediminis TaxID=1885917 RepID=UPI00138A65C2|nr:zf-HC2 domain-containing protein [Chengkuizengella sediminis]NDI33764.1 zf-HC2 domain-containing protein [Chengkuizengella sediminis]
MKCQEVIQLMQRDLDGDLNKEEHQQMIDHISDCHSCTEMFERLKNVSIELEQLPQVTPPVSIVDQILPQLEEIDQANIIETQVHDTGETEETLTTNIKKTTFTTLFKKAKPIAFLGASAAAVILIVFTALNSGDNLIMNDMAVEQSAPESIAENRALSEESTILDEDRFDADAAEIPIPKMDYDDQAALKIESEEPNESTESRSGEVGESGSEEEVKIPVLEEDTTLSMTFSEDLIAEGTVSPDGQYVINTRVIEEGGSELIVQKVDNQEILFTLKIEDNLSITKIEWLEDSQFILLETFDGEKKYSEQIDIFNPMQPS